MKKNAIVFMMDSLQFNYLGCYGNTWIHTPNIDRFAREGVLFENAYTEGVPTVPARRAMHTGRYTLPVSGWVPLSSSDTTIADLCWGHPIDTALVFDCPNYRLPKFGYTRGFDKVWFTHGHEGDDAFYNEDPLYHLDPDNYIEEHHVRDGDRLLGEGVLESLMGEISAYLRQHQYWKSDEDRYVAQTVKEAVCYLEKADRNKQFFLWVDSFDPHEPWDGPSVYMNTPCPYNPDYKGHDCFMPLQGAVDGLYTDEELHHVRMLYAECVSVCDKWFGYFLDQVRRLGLEESTLIMLVSDHGEPMGNGEHGHGIMRKCRPWPYEELVHVPMIIRGPGLPAGKRIASFVQSVDVAPTVCDWLGLGVHPNMQGKSLLPLAQGEVDKLRDFAIAGYHGFSWSIITEDWSYIHWLRKGDDEDPNAVLYGMYYDGIAGAMEGMDMGEDSGMAQRVQMYAPKDDGKSFVPTLDGEAQWTCTPGALAEVPQKDELYDRHKDPFQLNNIISEHPEIAKKLLLQLKDFILDLQS